MASELGLWLGLELGFGLGLGLGLGSRLLVLHQQSLRYIGTR